MRTFRPFGFALFGVLFLGCGGPMGTGPPEEGATLVDLPGLPAPPLVEPNLHPRPFERPTLGMPLEPPAPAAVELNPYARPHVWLAARTVAPGETVAVAAVGVKARTPVRLALEEGNPAAFRFCGTGYADLYRPAVRGECRIPPDATGAVRVVAYDGALAGTPLSSAVVTVTPETPLVRVLTWDPPPGAAIDLGGIATPNTLLRVSMVSPYQRFVDGFEIRTTDDGAWRARWVVPATAQLGRWRVEVRADLAVPLGTTSFVVRPLLGFEASRDHLAVYGAAVLPNTDVSFRFFDPSGEPAGETVATANRLGMFLLHAQPPACVPPGTWYARASYTDSFGDPAWYDVTFTTRIGWCFVY